MYYSLKGYITAYLIYLFVLLHLFLLSSCACVRRVSDFLQISQTGGVFRITRDIDLEGQTIVLPKNCKLVFNNHIISNGTLIGDNTFIYYKNHCFHNIKIKGTWNVPVIRSSMFTDYQDDDLVNLFNLQNGSIQNRIIVNPGNYLVSSNNRRSGLYLSSNTILQLDGTIVLESQSNNQFFNGYYVIYITGCDNVVVKGKGSIIGDLNRSGLESEYGHGMCIYESKNVSVSGISIRDIHGDGIAISKNNHKIFIHDLIIDNFYRNGISVIDGDSIEINNVVISHGGLYEPYAAIDVEPNEGDHISDVAISNVSINDCAVGIMGYVPKNASANNITYKGVSMTGISKCCLSALHYDGVSYKDVDIKMIDKDATIMRFIGNKQLLLDSVIIDAANNKAKYPFYIDNQKTTVINSSFNCPQLFTFHLGNASFKNTSFKYNSFIWTSADIANKNLVFDKCVFDGPFFLRPNNVTFTNSIFKVGDGQSGHITFEENRNFDDSMKGVFMENNVIEIMDSSETKERIRCSVRNSRVSNTSILNK